MKTVHLHGSLGEKYGTEFRLAINRPCEAIEALGHQLDGFFSTIAQGDWVVWRDDESIGMDMFQVTLNHCTDLHIVPALEGAKGGGKSVGKILVGVALIAVAVIAAPASVTMAGALGPTTASGLGATAFAGMTYGQIAILGGAIALGGVTALMTPVPSAGDINKREDPTTQRNGVLGGAGNTTEQGQPIPLPFGLIRTGSQVIQVGLYTEEVEPTDYVVSNAEFKLAMQVGTRTDDSAIVYNGAGSELYAPITPNDVNYVQGDIIEPYGIMSKQSFREKTIAQIAERTVEGQLRLEVVFKYSALPVDFFDRIRITTLGGSPLLDKVTLSATVFNSSDFTIEPVPAEWGQSSLSNGGLNLTGISNARKFTQWTWDLGASVLTVGQQYVVYLEYTK